MYGCIVSCPFSSQIPCLQVTTFPIGDFEQAATGADHEFSGNFDFVGPGVARGHFQGLTALAARNGAKEGYNTIPAGFQDAPYPVKGRAGFAWEAGYVMPVDLHRLTFLNTGYQEA